MTFDSAAFLFAFFPLAYIAYRAVPGEKGKNALLLALSLLFCAFGSLEGAGVLLVSAAADWGAGKLIMNGKWPRTALAGAVAVNLALLCVFKYLGFFAGALGVGLLPDIAVPLGVSFFTFKGISYVCDVYKNPESGSRRPGDVLLYMSFFPQFAAGPITRFGQFAPQLAARETTPERTASGLKRTVAGLGKKLLIAGFLAKFTDAVYALPQSSLDWRLCWLGAAAYTLQIYFDFSGYSDMAIGIGRMLGFDTPENFNYPYVSASITEFWRRWHISLSLWFRDYLYIPLGGNRKGRPRTALNKLTVFVLCGLWHGANWTYVLWGAWHGLLSALETLKVIDTKKLAGTGFGRAVSHIYAMLAVGLGFAMFRAGSVEAGFAVIRGMFSGFAVTAASELALRENLTPAFAAAFVLALVLSAPWGQKLRDKLAAAPEPARARADAASMAGSLVLLALCILTLARGNFAPFIYAQF